MNFNISQLQGHIFLVEDDDLLRESIEVLLRLAGYIVHSFSEPAAFLAAQVQVVPAVVISDMRMPGMSGVELQKTVISQGRSVPFIFISAESTTAEGILAMKQGAFDFLIKPFEREELLAAVAKAMELDLRQIQALAKKNKLQHALDRLSKREREVFDFLVQGYGNQQIVAALGISLHTAKQYKAGVMRKLGARSLADLIQLKVTDTLKN